MAPKVVEMGLEFNQFVEEGSCSFYGAPIAIIVTIDRLFPKLRYLDVGLSVSYLLLAAQARGLATCPIALGYADTHSPINRFKTERENLDAFRSWYE